MKTCYRCKKKNINPLKSRTEISMANYKMVDFNRLIRCYRICEKCNNELEKWLKAK